MADGKRTRPFVEQRRKTILSIIQESGRASVSDLAERLSISPLTVRRDLDWLENDGAVVRRYGEAVLPDDVEGAIFPGDPFHDQKLALAQAAAKLVHDNDLVYINTSSTALMVVEHIHAQGVTIVTNSMHAQELACPPGGMVLITGGEVRPPRGVLSGEFALNNIRNVSATICFLGCAGISTTAGVTSTTQQEAMVNSLMVDQSEKFVLVCDSSKLGVAAGFTYAPLNNISLLITDAGATDEDIQTLSDLGVQEIVRVQ